MNWRHLISEPLKEDDLLKSIIVAARPPARSELSHSRMGFGWVAGVDPLDISFDRAPVGARRRITC
jgi:hypothetical protein